MFFFYLGATHSFNSVKLVETLGLTPTCKSSLLPMTLSYGKTVMCKELYEGYPIGMHECEFLADLYGFELTNFGLSWEWTD